LNKSNHYCVGFLRGTGSDPEKLLVDVGADSGIARGLASRTFADRGDAMFLLVDSLIVIVQRTAPGSWIAMQVLCDPAVDTLTKAIALARRLNSLAAEENLKWAVFRWFMRENQLLLSPISHWCQSCSSRSLLKYQPVRLGHILDRSRG